MEGDLNAKKFSIACGTILTISLGLGGLPGRQPQKVSRTGSNPPGGSATKIWKSQVTRREYRVKVDQDVFYAEWTPDPTASAQSGAYIRTECRRAGSKWFGISLSYLPCEDRGKGVKKWCHLTTLTEIDAITSERIVGRSESLHRFDCQSCKVLEAVMSDFVWVPFDSAQDLRPKR